MCLDSLLNQNLNHDDYEIIIINDGSTDGSLQIANTYKLKYSNISIHSQKNSGVGAARNKGVSIAKGDYIYFIDPDDYLACNVLNKLMGIAKEHELDILTFESQITTSSNLNVSNGLEYSTDLPLLDGIAYIANNTFKNEVWWYLIKKEFLKNSEVKFIEGRWMEDAIFTATLFLKASTMLHVQVDAHRHVIVPGSAMTSRESSHYLKVIYDNANAATVYKSLIENIKAENVEEMKCVKRLKTRQQSFVFFMMVRMLKSSIKLAEIKNVIETVERSGAYPLTSFIGVDYNKMSYKILTAVFNNKYLYYACFRFFNPIFKSSN
jgi:glycosyltransferase involved in cell wall biosynthesis